MKTSLLIAVLFAVCVPTIGLGQKGVGDEDGYGIFRSQDEYYDFMGTIKESVEQNPEMKEMIPLINDVVLGKPIGSTSKQYGIESTVLGMLSDSKVRADLEMVDEQYDELKRLNSEIQKRTADELRGLDLGDTDNLVGELRRIRNQAEDDLNAVLLPHQARRLRQIRTQSQMRYRSLVDILTNEPLKSELKITDRQSSELKEAEKAIERDLERQIARLREKARQRLLSRLNPSQKEKVQEMIGDAFDFDSPKKKRRETERAKGK